MKFAMNGALTIGTLDGANVEIREEVGAENFFLFGLTVAEVTELKAKGYHPRHFYESNNELHEAIDRIAAGHFSGGMKGSSGLWWIPFSIKMITCCWPITRPTWIARTG
jgi:starch phosphorylase